MRSVISALPLSYTAIQAGERFTHCLHLASCFQVTVFKSKISVNFNRFIRIRTHFASVCVMGVCGVCECVCVCVCVCVSDVWASVCLMCG
jgi:hypothetical protein